MKTIALSLLVATLGLAPLAAPQQDSLVVDDTGFVGVGTAAPDEAVQVIASLVAPSVRTPPRCNTGIPVRIFIHNAVTGDAIVLSEATLSDTSSRTLTAVLPASTTVDQYVQAGVLVDFRLVDCITSETTAVGPGGIRKLSR